MIIKDIRREFFDTLKGRILIMCALDVDAVCSCRILQFLLESHNLQYSVAPVDSASNLWELFEEYRNSIDALITINFGNLINLPELLKPPEGLLFYVIDSHRPINVHNFYKNPQVRLYISSDERDLNIPARSKVFLGGATQDDDDEEQQLAGLLEASASDLTNQQLEKRRELRQWLANRERLLFDYEEFHFYNRSVALIMHDLAHRLSKSNNYLLWLGIVGATHLLRADKISAEAFEREAERLIRHISSNEVSCSQVRANSWKIRWQKDLQLDLYRYWSLWDSFRNTPLTVCRFQLWNDKGQRNLHEFLVATGLRLTEAKVLYPAMKLEYRSELVPRVQEVCLGDLQHKYNLHELICRAFVMRCGFGSSFAASDFVLSVQALLESHEPGLKLAEKFVRVNRALIYDKEFPILNVGFEKARLQLSSMFQQVRYLITNQKIIDQGSFVFADLQEHPDVSRNFAYGGSLTSFARFLLEAYVSSKPSRVARRAARLPLVLFSQDFSNQELVLMAGVPPMLQESKKNFFGKAFQQAAMNADCEIKPDLSESNLVRTSINNKNLMLEQLKLLLA